MIDHLVKGSRSFRRFTQEKISLEKLQSLVEVVRFTPSAANLQPLRYIISTDIEKNRTIFDSLKWAGYLKDWDGPEEGERPSGYIVILSKRVDDFTLFDVGIASQTILLNCFSEGLGGTIFLGIDKEKLKKDLNSDLEVVSVIAIGKPVEEVEIVEPKDGDIKYYRDNNGKHFVPKRSLEELIIGKY
jgi:nitroreductase